MKSVYTKIVENTEGVFWIMKEDISNKSTKRSYPLQITNIPIVNTVAVYIVNEEGKESQMAQLACVDYEVLKQKYESGEDINLNYTYIDNFSWYGTDKLYEVDEYVLREIEGFSACCSFWNAQDKEKHLVSLMQLKIKNRDMCFNHSIFFKTVFIPQNIMVLNGGLDFAYSKFYDSELIGMGISCNKGMYHNGVICCNYTEYKDSKVWFDFIKDEMDIDFLLAKMINTDLEISNPLGKIRNICLTKADIDSLKLNYCEIETLDARELKVNKVGFRGCKFKGLVEIHVLNELEMNIENCVINSEMKLDFDRPPKIIGFSNTLNSGKIYIKKFKEVLPAILDGIEETKNIEQLLMLKENFKNLGEYIYEDLCYATYRKLENKIYTKSITTRWINNINYAVSNYGTQPIRMFLCIIVLILGFAAMYYVCPFIQFENAVSFIDYIYISGITFFTVGYGDILPLNDITKMIVLIQAFLGVSSMSYFLVVLSRKIIR